MFGYRRTRPALAIALAVNLFAIPVYAGNPCGKFLSGVKDFVKAIGDMNRLISAELDDAVLNENLWAFYGFHQNLGISHYRQRTYDKVNPKNASPTEVHGIEVQQMVAILKFAMEIEDPIAEYTEQSGNGLRFILPNLGRFMGKNKEQAAFVKESGNGKWCESPWCAEERRHGHVFAHLIEALTGVAADRSNLPPATITSNDEAGGIRHLSDRQGTEWGASSAYFILAAHSEGDLNTAIMNVLRDEVKHLTVVSSADTYLFGYRPNFRLARIVRKNIREYFEGRKQRSGGGSLTSNPFVIAKIIAAHVLIEIRMRQYLRTLPLATLVEIFDSPSNQPELAAVDLTPGQKSEIQKTLQEGRVKRDSLMRWSENQREEELAQRVFEGQFGELIDLVLSTKLGGLQGVESSPERMTAVLKQIKALDTSVYFGGWDHDKGRLLKAALTDRVFDYRIRNNPLVLSRKNQLPDGHP